MPMIFIFAVSIDPDLGVHYSDGEERRKEANRTHQQCVDAAEDQQVAEVDDCRRETIEGRARDPKPASSEAR